MAKSKNNNIIYIGIVAVVIIVAIIIGIVVGNNGGNGGDEGSGGEETSQTEGLTASDLATVDVTVEYGDYDGMEALAKDIQNGYATGKVVQIEGDVSHPMSTYSIVEQNEDGTGSIGTRFIIVGETGYPEDKDHVVITGKVIELEPLVYVIQTLPDFVEVQ